MTDDAVQPTLWGDEPDEGLEPARVVPVRQHVRVLPGHGHSADKPAKRRTRKPARLPDGAAAAAAAKAAAEAAVEAHADDEWKSLALAAVGWCAKHHELFTADEVWTRLAEYPEVGTHEPAAIGPVFLRASKNGWIVKSGQTRRSTYSQRHRDLTVWASKVYEGPPS